MRKKLTLKNKKKIIALAETGISHEALASRFDVSKSTIYLILVTARKIAKLLNKKV